MELLKKYIAEISQDLEINDLNIKEAQMRLPARKHFWVARLIDAKIALTKLQAAEKDLRNKLAKKINEDAPVKLATQTIDNILNQRDEIKELVAQITEYKYIIEYLEKTEKIMSSLHWEIKNIVNLMQLEQT